MSDNDIVVVSGQKDISVVATPQDQVVTTITKEVTTVAVQNMQAVVVPQNSVQVVTVACAGGGSGASTPAGAVFALDVTPTTTGIIGDMVYDADTVPASTVVASCVSDTNNVRVHVGAEGGTVYSPVVTINGIEATLTESATKRWFTGYADIVLAPGANTILVESSAGGTDTFTITTAGAGPLVLSCTFGSYPGTQTELKLNDTMTATVTTELTATVLVLQSGGASNTYQEFPVVTGSASISFPISALSGAQSISLKAKNSLGTLGEVFVSTALTLNQTAPTVGVISVVYPLGQTALDSAETAEVSSTVTNFDTITYASANVTIPNTTTYEATKTVTQLTNGYVGSGTNYMITANRAANNSTSVRSGLIRIATVAPTASISQVPTGRMVSSPAGISYEIRIYASQLTTGAPTLDASHGTWQGSWSDMGTYWKRNLLVDDGVARGAGTYSGLSITGLSGITGTSITAGGTYYVGGFSSRVLTFPAFSRVAAIGTAVADRLRTSFQVGTQLFTRYDDNAQHSTGYYVANADGSYNPNGTYFGLSDSLFAGSNTTGTLQATVQEIA